MTTIKKVKIPDRKLCRGFQTVDKGGAGALAPAPLFLPKCQLPYFLIKDKKAS
ncbi:hypothetical protein H9X90_09940 [Faecalicatena contorta]|nr:hypothetical protein [Faecalicatena contorta]